MIDDKDSSRMSGPFNWTKRHRATGRMIDITTEQGRWALTTEHNGYQRQHGVRHERRLERSASRSFVVEDRLRGRDSSLPAAVRYLIHPEFKVQRRGVSWTVDTNDDCTVLKITPSEPCRSCVLRGSDTPRGGWYSPQFGTKVPASQLILASTFSPSKWFGVTLEILPGQE